ncbi:hypothetical protein JET18_15525 [Chryseobacterium sp. L7]|uniref:Uncharacterized protein n=1 Tax=Chryseobacterium endalhagicum TaxID=2797638 RepID=A0ABS1QI32_9FLAO|nr:hypothetical protein [Chryseobacterium endalhagicum]MBL1222263.1 hypothetical protein [Chryseobacterium endalhagicum]
MKKTRYSTLGWNTFLISFVSGTLLLLGYLITKADFLIISGFYFVLIAAVVNLLILFYELLEFLTNIPDKKSSGRSVLLLLINIPVTMLYMYIVFSLDP